MINLSRQVITKAANDAGISNIIDISKDSILLLRPRIDVQYFTEIFNKTGRRLAIDKDSSGIKTVLTVYEVTLPVACTLYTDSDTELALLSDTFIKALPRSFADESNNIVRLWVTSSNWQVVGGKQLGDIKIEPIIKRSRLIKLDFTYHMTEDKYAEYLKDFEIKIKYEE